MSLKVALVGMGRMGKFHLEILKRIKDTEVVAICDVKEEVVKNLAKELRTQFYSNYEDMYKREKLDAVFICTPAYAREKQLELAVQAGIHIFVEKPVARTMEEGERACKAIEESGVICSVGFHWRYSEGAKKVKEVLKDKKLALIDARWYHTIPPIAWVRSKEMGGGQVVDQSIHLIDLMRYWIGEVKEVYAQAVRGLFPEIGDFTADDASAVTLKFKNGTIANLSSTYSLFPGANLGPRMDLIAKRMHIEFTMGKVIICKPKKEELEFDEQAHLAHMRRPPEANVEQCETKINEASVIEDEIFLEAIKNRDISKIKSSFRDGLKTLEITLAANRSISTGRVVTLSYA